MAKDADDRAAVGAPPSPRGVLVRNVVVLGLVSLLTDAASEIVIPLLPAFLATMGAGALALGVIEGVADFVASVLKLASGAWSDRLGKRRPFVVAGYSLSSAVRPLYALASGVGFVLAIRVADRVGKGLRSSPRDALLASSVPEEKRGAAFGVHRAMDHAGAVIGPLVAFALLASGVRDLRAVFLATAIPGALAVLLVVFAVRDSQPVPPRPLATTDVTAAREPRPAMTDETAAREPLAVGALARVLVPLGLFSLGRASDTFLLLRVGEADGRVLVLPLLWMGLHAVKSVSSVFGGRLADSFGRRRVVLVGWVVFALVSTGLALATSHAVMVTLFLLYGLHHGLTEGAEKALVAGVGARARHGEVFGWYHASQGLVGLVANVAFGMLWTSFSATVAFGASAVLATLAALLLVILARTPAAAK